MNKATDHWKKAPLQYYTVLLLCPIEESSMASWLMHYTLWDGTQNCTYTTSTCSTNVSFKNNINLVLSFVLVSVTNVWNAISIHLKIYKANKKWILYTKKAKIKKFLIPVTIDSTSLVLADICNFIRLFQWNLLIVYLVSDYEYTIKLIKT